LASKLSVALHIGQTRGPAFLLFRWAANLARPSVSSTISPFLRTGNGRSLAPFPPSRHDRRLGWLMDRSPCVTFAPVHRSCTGGKQMKLKPLGERALVKMIEGEEQTASGIVLPDTARQKPQTAEIVAVGTSEDVKVSVGDVVVLAKYSGTEVKIEGEEHLIVDADDILGVMEG
jgi:chaperonin GroES